MKAHFKYEKHFPNMLEGNAKTTETKCMDRSVQVDMAYMSCVITWCSLYSLRNQLMTESHLEVVELHLMLSGGWFSTYVHLEEICFAKRGIPLRLLIQGLH